MPLQLSGFGVGEARGRQPRSQIPGQRIPPFRMPADDPRVKGTVAAIEKQLMRDGFVARYDTHVTKDGLPPGEGVFLPCTFWYADNL